MRSYWIQETIKSGYLGAPTECEQLCRLRCFSGEASCSGDRANRAGIVSKVDSF